MNVDTLSIARDLRAAELPPEQAEAIAAAIGRSVSEGSATKADLDLTTRALKSDMELFRAGLEAKLEQLRTEIERSRNQTIMWLVTAQIATVGFVVAILKL